MSMWSVITYYIGNRIELTKEIIFRGYDKHITDPLPPHTRKKKVAHGSPRTSVARSTLPKKVGQVVRKSGTVASIKKHKTTVNPM